MLWQDRFNIRECLIDTYIQYGYLLDMPWCREQNRPVFIRTDRIVEGPELVVIQDGLNRVRHHVTGQYQYRRNSRYYCLQITVAADVTQFTLQGEIPHNINRIEIWRNTPGRRSANDVVCFYRLYRHFYWRRELHAATAKAGE